MELDAIAATILCALSGAWLIVENALPAGGVLLVPFFGWTLWLAAGALAATTAELLKKPVLPHTLLGLCLPYLYPVLLARRVRQAAAREQVREEEVQQQVHEEQQNALSARFRAMHEKREQERRERIAERQGVDVEDVPARPKETSVPEPEPLPEAVASAPAEEPNEIYAILYSQPVDDSGARPGPFQFTLMEGDTLDVDSVRELAPQFMVCILSGSGKSVRIRYGQVAEIARYEE